MIAVILEQLKKSDNPLATTLVNIIENKLPAVEDSFYESTVFGSKAGYLADQFQTIQAVTNNFGKPLVETPLTYVRGNVGPVFTASPGQGITTGTVLFNYVTKKPLLLMVVDKDGTTYRYQSAKYNAETKTFNQLTNKTKAAKSVAELATLINTNIANDIATFVTTK
jgi:hypothetical protein